MRVAPLVLLVMIAATGRVQADSPPVRLSVEFSWRSAPLDGGLDPTITSPGTELSLGVSGGTIRDALSLPDSGYSIESPPSPISGPDAEGFWKAIAGPNGRVRALIEAPIDSSVTIGTPGDLRSVPLIALLDGPQRPFADPSFSVEVRRLPWDAIEVQAPGDGFASPGAIVPVTVGVNVLTPEATEVGLLLSARLKGIRTGRVHWEESRKSSIPTNPSVSPAQILNVPMPTDEGTYVLELIASWSPGEPQAEGTRLGRWWRRLRNRSTDLAVRRVSLVVVNPAVGFATTGTAAEPLRNVGLDRGEGVVDSVELGRVRGLRPMAEGRGTTGGSGAGSGWPIPPELLVDPPRRERIWSLIGRVGSNYRALPASGLDGESWVAVPLKVAHPDRPHRLDVTVLGGDPAAMSVAMVVPGPRPRVVLDVRGFGEETPVGIGPSMTLSWPTWPDSTDLVLIVVNRSPARPLWLGEARLVEQPDNLAPLNLIGPPEDGGRTLAVRVSGPEDLQRFGGSNDSGPADPVSRARNLASYLRSIGASAVVLPSPTADRSTRASMAGQAAEDSIGPDHDQAIRVVLKRRGIATVVEVTVDGVSLPGLPAPDDPEARELGIVRVDRSGEIETDRPSYNLLRPEVQRALTRHVLAAAGGIGSPPMPRPDGILLRLGPGPSLPGRPDVGFDDQTYARFLRDAIKGGDAPGLNPDDPGRFASRHQYLTGPALVPWLTWRSRQVGSFYGTLGGSVAEAAPGVVLMVATPGLDDGPNGAEARRFDRDGLTPDSAWRSLGLDLADWPRGNGPLPYVLRGIGTGSGGLEHDLATHPALDAQVLGRPSRGVLLGLDDPESAPERPEGTLSLSADSRSIGDEGDELLAHSLAALDAGWVVISSAGLAGQEERIARFARVFRSLPKPGAGTSGSALGGLAGRVMSVGDRSYVCFANDTPFALRLTSVISIPSAAMMEDLGRGMPLPSEVVPGGRRISIDLPPFGYAALRVGAPGARLASVSAGFDPKREAHRSAVERRLQTVASGGSISHLNPGFEPESVVRRASSEADPDEELTGWSTEGAPGASLSIDLANPRTGRGSLRLTAPEAPATATSPAFLPPGSAATLRAFLRTDPPDAAVRVRIESEPGSTIPVHLAADLPERDRKDWDPLALRAPGLPTDGASQLRLRFELRSPGRLWIDDLSLTGSGLAQARSCLTAALQAYDEGRFADFARLSRSHWVLEAGGPIEPEAPPRVLAPIAGEAATDLPDRSRLR